jgi:erythromycin esterase
VDKRRLVVRDWIRRHARAFPLDGQEVVSLLPPSATGAAVVGVAATVRSSREIVLAGQAILRDLALHAGFRGASIEGADETGPALDRYVVSGAGDPESLVRSSQSFLRTRETLELVEWIRGFNLDHAEDPIRIVHDLSGPADGNGLEHIEKNLARSVLEWREEHGSRIVHLGGTAHAVIGDPRTVSPYSGDAHRNAGAYLRGALGNGYQAFGLTSGPGRAPFPVPEPPASFTEAVFAESTDPALLLDLHADPSPPSEVAEWLRTPLGIRCVGPAYDPANDAAHHVTAGPVRDALDALLHVSRTTPTTL